MLCVSGMRPALRCAGALPLLRTDTEKTVYHIARSGEGNKMNETLGGWLIETMVKRAFEHSVKEGILFNYNAYLAAKSLGWVF